MFSIVNSTFKVQYGSFLKWNQYQYHARDWPFKNDLSAAPHYTAGMLVALGNISMRRSTHTIIF